MQYQESQSSVYEEIQREDLQNSDFAEVAEAFPPPPQLPPIERRIVSKKDISEQERQRLVQAKIDECALLGDERGVEFWKANLDPLTPDQTARGMAIALKYGFLERFVCPDCGGEKFLEGPHGGLSINFCCAGCGARFNDAVGTIQRFDADGDERKWFRDTGFVPMNGPIARDYRKASLKPTDLRDRITSHGRKEERND